MNWIDRVLFDISQVAGITLPRIAAGVLALTICIWLISALWSRRIRAVTGVLGLLAGGLLLAMALDTRILHWLVATSYLVRIRMLMGLLSVVVVTVTFEAIRRSHLRERYALLWVITGLMILLCAGFPSLLSFLSVALNVQYVTAVVMVVFAFLILIAFHFSISLSGLIDDRTRLAQHCARLEVRLREVEARLGMRPVLPELRGTSEVPAALVPDGTSDDVARDRRVRGTLAGAILAMVLAVVAVIWVGLDAPQAMIGDEVTHYYMLVNQAQSLPTPVYSAEIPAGWGSPEVRGYPHPNLWHYLGAIVYRLSGESFAAVQIYHALFWAQLLVVGFLLARSRADSRSRAPLLYVLTLASLPMGLLFSVAFYQDVPLAAQALTAFYLLSRRRFLSSAVFLALAVAMKVTGVVFVLPYVALLAVQLWRRTGDGGVRPAQGLRRLLIGAVCLGLVVSAIIGTGWSLKRYGGAAYYPVKQLESGFKSLGQAIKQLQSPAPPSPAPGVTAPQVKSGGKQRVHRPVIANHPGDLRIPVNFFIYGGLLLWVVLLLAVVGRAREWLRRTKPTVPPVPGGWLWWVGGFYLVVVAWQLRTAPDARFFLPGLVFLILPLVEVTVRLPRVRLLLAILSAMALFQSAQVLIKARNLRTVSPELKAVIAYLRAQPPTPNQIFMYPEGSYRLFPSPHQWYMNYRLRELWRADNDGRMALFHTYEIGALVIKKHLIRRVDAAITDLGVYPDTFVRDIAADPRFKLGFENAAAIVYRVPEPPAGIRPKTD